MIQTEVYEQNKTILFRLKQSHSMWIWMRKEHSTTLIIISMHLCVIWFYMLIYMKHTKSAIERIYSVQSV